MQRKFTLIENEIKKFVIQEKDCNNQAELITLTHYSDSCEKRIETLEESILNLESDDAVNGLLEQTEGSKDTMRILRCNIQKKLLELQVANSNLNSNRELSSSQNASLNLKPLTPRLPILPTLNLPLFKGELHTYLSFWESFNTNIDSKQDISDFDKFGYFLSLLREEPLRFAQRFTQSAENYPIMRKEFEKEYKKTCQLVYLHLDHIFKIPKIKNQNKTELKALVNIVRSEFQNLFILEQPIKDCGVIFVKLILDKLDIETLQQWNMSRDDYSVPKLEELLAFIDKVANSLSREDKPTRVYKNYSSTVEITKEISCIMCKQAHKIFGCPSLLKLSPSERLNKVKSFKLCFNCLSGQHMLPKCPSKSTCKICNERHNTILHRDYNHVNSNGVKELGKKSLDSSPSKVGESKEFLSVTSCIEKRVENQSSHILLATALVAIKDRLGKKHIARILLDSGSQCTTISKSFAQKLNLPMKSASISVAGIVANQNAKCKHTIKLKFTSVNNNCQSFTTEALVLDKLIHNLPEYTFEKSKFTFLNHLKLADPKFNESNSIDIVLGGKEAFDILFGGQRIDSPDKSLIAIDTSLGWVIMGQFNNNQNSSLVQSNVIIKSPPTDLISKIWELEETPILTKILSPEDKRCEKLFCKSISKLPNNKYSVDLLFKEYPPNLGDSLINATKRFYALEKKLEKDPKLKSQYSTAFHDYLQAGHMESISDLKLNSSHFYLPHHGIIRESSLTTKLRIVFDGSHMSSNGVSLNQTLLVGPSLQQDIRHLLLRFRFFKYVITMDLHQMYRNIEINPVHRDYLRVLWRDNPSEELQHYRLKTVTFGLTSAPYSAIRLLHYLADNHELTRPMAAKIIKEHFYVDDLLTGSNSKSELIKNIQELVYILNTANFKCDKWASNSQSILNELNKLGHNTTSEASLALLSSTNTLGIRWNISEDNLSFNLDNPSTKTLTKRILLSTLAKVYDPLGLLSPFLLLLKLVLQESWTLKLGWDTKLPENHQMIWLDLISNFSLLEQFQVPRLAIDVNALSYEIHGFSDASEKGFGIAVYLVSHSSDNSFTSNLLFARSKVSPLHFMSMPKLELASCHLLAKTYQFYERIFPVKIQSVTFYSDSQIALSWIKSKTYKFKTFVANRVYDINSLVPHAEWKYINTSLNPADIVSRGLILSKLINNQKWLSGPFNEPLFIENLTQSPSISEVINQSIGTADIINEIKPKQVFLTFYQITLTIFISFNPYD